ncbi:MAG: hypothetical protein GXN92_01355 [Candidatus Micrarchaeota archaeon]|nr:hypothetical protein [Candidatus Micrarchaeota archaeon]
MYKQAKKLLIKLSAYFHEAHFPHLHRRFSRPEVIHINNLRKRFLEIIATDKTLLDRLKHDKDVVVCPELLTYLSKGSLPDYEAEEVFQELKELQSDFRGALLFDVVRRLFALPPHRWKDIIAYWSVRDKGFYYLIMLEKAFQEQSIPEAVRWIEYIKALDDPRLERYLLSKPTEFLEKVAEVFA